MSSIVDVAKRAGVSVTTVSRVINNSPHRVYPETRQRVLKAAQELNYKPSALARALVSNRSCLIGVLVGDIVDPYFAVIARGITDAAREHGYLTLICNSDRVVDLELDYVQMLRDYHVDGIIFAGGGLTDAKYLKKMKNLLISNRKQMIPTVTLARHLLNNPQVNIDNVQAARDMTDYLIGLGHRQIGFISGPSHLTTSVQRLEGYKQSLNAHDIPYQTHLVFDGNFSYESGFDIGMEILSLEKRPTAIFGSNDISAIGCLTCLQAHGIRVPEEISLAGFDDIAAAQYTHPNLTTVRVPMREMGITGMNQLVRLIAKETIEDVILPHALVIRSSCSSPAKNGT